MIKEILKRKKKELDDANVKTTALLNQIAGRRQLIIEIEEELANPKKEETK